MRPVTSRAVRLFFRHGRGPAPLSVIAATLRTASLAVYLALPAVLGTDSFGVYAYAIWVAALAGQVGVLGYPTIIARTASHRVLPMRHVYLTSGTIGLVVATGLLVFSSVPESVELVVGIYVQTMAAVFVALAQANLRRENQFAAIARSEAVASVIRFGGFGALFLLHALSPATAVWLEFGALFANAIACAAQRARTQPTQIEMQADLAFTPLLLQAVNLGALGLVDSVLWQRGEVFFLGYGPSALQAIARFSLALQLGSAGAFLPAAVLNGWLPTIARPTTRARQLASLGRTFFLLYLGYIVLGGLGATVLLVLIYPSYIVPEVVVLIASRLLELGVGFFATVLYAKGKERALWPVVASSAGLSLVLSTVLIPRTGLPGAVIAYVLAHAFLTLGTILAYYYSIIRADSLSGGDPPSPGSAMSDQDLAKIGV